MTWYVVDGMDGSGKSTTAAIIANHLASEGHKVKIITHPNRDTAVGRIELAFLRMEGKVAMLLSILFYMLDILHSLGVMRGRGCRDVDDVIFVRYIMAVAYLPDSLCRRAYRMISQVLPIPDIAVLVDVDPVMAMERIRNRGEKLEMFERPDRLEVVRRRMLGLSEGWVVLENGSGMDDLEDQVLNEVFGGLR